jgi:hypothetical protein
LGCFPFGLKIAIYFTLPHIEQLRPSPVCLGMQLHNSFHHSSVGQEMPERIIPFAAAWKTFITPVEWIWK